MLGLLNPTTSPTAGKYDYPFFDLDSCIEKLETYHKVVQTDETSRDEVATILKMVKAGGGFVNLISSMKSYGLIETGRNSITITDLGKKILYGEPSEKEQLKRKAVSNIDLFREICEQYGKDASEEQVRSFIRQKANVDISKVAKIAENAYTIYKKVSMYIIPAKKGGFPSTFTEGSSPNFGRREISMENVTGGKEPLRIQKGGLYIEIADDENKAKNIEEARDYLDFQLQRLSPKKGALEQNS